MSLALCSSSCSSLGRAVARVVRRRRRRACARAGRRRSPPAGTATARRPGRDAGSRRLRARFQRSSSTSFLAPRSSRATSSGGEAWATGPIRRRAARKHTPPARGRSGVAGENRPHLLGENGETLLAVVLPKWRLAREARAAARGTIGFGPSGALDAQPRGARAPCKLDIKLRHGRALLPSASNLTLLDQFRRSDYVEKEKSFTSILFFLSQEPEPAPIGWGLARKSRKGGVRSNLLSSLPLPLLAAPPLAAPVPPTALAAPPSAVPPSASPLPAAPLSPATIPPAALPSAAPPQTAPRVTVAGREYPMLWQPEESPVARSFERLLAAAFRPGGMEREAAGRAVLSQFMLLSPRLASIGWNRIRAAATAATSGGDEEEARRMGGALGTVLRQARDEAAQREAILRQTGPRRGDAECRRAGGGHVRVDGLMDKTLEVISGGLHVFAHMACKYDPRRDAERGRRRSGRPSWPRRRGARRGHRCRASHRCCLSAAQQRAGARHLEHLEHLECSH